MPNQWDVSGFPSAILFAASFLAASVRDIRTMEIPDWCPALLLAAGTVRILEGSARVLPSISALLVVGGALLALSLWRDGLGGGDVKLAGAASFVVGIPAGFTALAISAAAALAFVLLRRLRFPEKGEAVPMAPFLMLGFFLVYP